MPTGKPRCPRCGKETVGTMMSRFNTDMICLDCIKKEQQHPAYAKAAEAELAAVRSGNLNFPGIGKPVDL